MKKLKLTLTTKAVGKNGHDELRDQLESFVRECFDTLYEGAVRLGCNITEDNYAPRRVQINATRLHDTEGLKIAAGHHKYNDDAAASESQLRETVKDLQTLIDAAAEVIPAPFTLNIVESEKKC